MLGANTLTVKCLGLEMTHSHLFDFSVIRIQSHGPILMTGEARWLGTVVFLEVKLPGQFKQKGIGRQWDGLWGSGQEIQPGFSQGWEQVLTTVRVQGGSFVPLPGHRTLFSTEGDQLILVCLRLSDFSTDSSMS